MLAKVFLFVSTSYIWYKIAKAVYKSIVNKIIKQSFKSKK